MLRRIVFFLLAIVLVLVLAVAVSVAWLRSSNIPDRDRDIDNPTVLGMLDSAVRVKRDRQGIPYIYAETLADALRIQGFVTAQDRLAQMLLTRELIHGRLAQQIGVAGLRSDTLIRVMGLPRLGSVWAQQLESPSRELHEWYLQGVNAYIETQADEFPLAVRLSANAPEPFTLEDLTTQYLFLAFNSTGNWRAEVLSQALVDHLGAEKAAEISMLTVNPDDESEWASDYSLAENSGPNGMPVNFPQLPEPSDGSNSWATSGPRSAGGAPIVANDPHIDARRLPGIWHPVGLITPEWRAVGAAGAGLPGLGAGRSSHVAWGITNAYSDVADLFIEQDDPQHPGHYLEGEQSVPYRVVEEEILIRDRRAAGGYRKQPLNIRYTRRGPVISDHGLTSDDGRVYSLRWSMAEHIGSQIGIERVMLARDAFEAGEIIGQINAPYNYTVGDTQGNIAHYTAGRAPVRRRGDGALPVPVVGEENDWPAFVPFARAPTSVNPPRGWVGNANHRTVSGDFDGHWTSYVAASWRYRRMRELFDGDGVLSGLDHWAAINDTLNPMARVLVPLMIQALEADPQTQAAADVLRGWDLYDEPEQAGAALFQVMMQELVVRVFEDELGGELARRYASDIYYWQERLHRMLLAGEWDWFDDGRTEAVEGRDELFRASARHAWAQLEQLLGDDPGEWQWGNVSRFRFSNPWVPGELADRLLGGGDYPGRGSGETLGRARYRGQGDYDPRIIDSLRFVADLADEDKVLAVIPGGVSSRLFDPHLNDQLPTWLSGEIGYWWFSDQAISADTEKEMNFRP